MVDILTHNPDSEPTSLCVDILTHNTDSEPTSLFS